MTDVLRTLEGVFLLIGLIVVFYAGISAVRLNLGRPAWLLVTGSGILLLMHTLQALNIPTPPLYPGQGMESLKEVFPAYLQAESHWELLRNVQRSSIIFGRFILALGILGVVRRVAT